MQLNDFQYDLPDELIARYPVAPRSGSRLLHLDRNSGEIAHRKFSSLPELLVPGDLLVFNDTQVIPARLYGYKSTGGKVEILIERIIGPQRALVHLKASKAPKPGTKIFLSAQIVTEVIQRQDEFFELKFLIDRPLLSVLHEIGHIPLPPYMGRSAEKLDEECYQTIFAKQPGAVAAPTAGLHFDQPLITELTQQGVKIAYITLHVGAGTFLPVRVNNIAEHVMHKEFLTVPAEVCQQIAMTKANGNKVIAVGTTTVRSLETAAQYGTLQAFTGDTAIFIYPGFQFRCVDAMITNFHVPQSTLLMLVSAFAGRSQIMAAYHAAIAEKYRFFSYGDAMLIV